MSTYHYSHLAYGIDLGYVEDVKIKEAGEYGRIDFPWMLHDEDGEPTEDLSVALTRRLYELIPDAPKLDKVFLMDDPVDLHYGVRVLEHGWPCSGLPSWVLAAHHISVSGGDIAEIDPDEMKEAAKEGRWDQKINQALTVLGITPLKPKPAWLLLADR